MKTLSPLKSIRAFCIYCMGGNAQLANGCTAKATCPLYPYRNGSNPHRNDPANVTPAMLKAREESAKRFRALMAAKKTSKPAEKKQATPRAKAGKPTKKKGAK